jgi:sulfur relay (sulfurtransferase) complex TusBCD TusD component (DsrE family)
VQEAPTPDGYYTLGRMLKSFARRGGNIACCGTCLDARGLTKERLVDEADRSTIDELATWIVEAETSSPSESTDRVRHHRIIALSSGSWMIAL